MSSGALTSVLESLTPLDNSQNVPPPPRGTSMKLPEGSKALNVPQFVQKDLRNGRVGSRKKSSRERRQGTSSSRSCRECGEGTHTNKGTCVHIRAVGDVLKSTMWSRLEEATEVSIEAEPDAIPSKAKILIVVARSMDSAVFMCVPHQNIMLDPILPVVCISARVLEDWCKKGDSRSKTLVLGSRNYVACFHGDSNDKEVPVVEQVPSDDDDLEEEVHVHEVEVTQAPVQVLQNYDSVEGVRPPESMGDAEFEDLWAHVQDQDTEISSYKPAEDKPIVLPRHQEGHPPRRARKPPKDDEDWGVVTSKKAPKRSRSSHPKVDQWHDCLDCGKWRKLERRSISSVRFVCARVGVSCSDTCDCDEDCDCNN